MALEKIGNRKTTITTLRDGIKVVAKDLDRVIDAFNAIVPDAGTASANTITEYTAGSGVTIDGVLIKDNTVTAVKDNISAVASATLTAVDSGKVFFIGDSAAVNYILPTCEAGLKFKWIVIANENDATTITTSDTTDTTGEMLRGGLLVHSAPAINTFVEAAGDVNKLTLDDNVADCGCGIGSWVEIIGTKAKTWFVTGVINGTSDNDGTGAALFSDVD
jgi:hypothetical protein